MQRPHRRERTTTQSKLPHPLTIASSMAPTASRHACCAPGTPCLSWASITPWKSESDCRGATVGSTGGREAEGREHGRGSQRAAPEATSARGLAALPLQCPLLPLLLAFFSASTAAAPAAFLSGANAALMEAASRSSVDDALRTRLPIGPSDLLPARADRDRGGAGAGARRWAFTHARPHKHTAAADAS